MRTSEQINEISAALAKAQAIIKNPAKDKVNLHFKSKYADLAAGLECILPALSSQGIAFIQATEIVGDGVILITRLAHSSGQWIESTYPVCKFDKPQIMAASLTYAKRQAGFSIVAVCGDEDDDGNAADKADTRTAPKKVPEPAKLTDEESENVYQVMRDTLQMCDSLDSVKAWVSANRAAKARLSPDHQEWIAQDYKDRLAEVMQPIAAE